jgi:molybdopterin molybdotransferase
MKNFFKVSNLNQVLESAAEFPIVEIEKIALTDAIDRRLAEDIIADADLPGFPRAVMDGYAVCASSVFGASGGNPAYLNVIGAVTMGKVPSFTVNPGESCKISTGGMLPKGADSVVMVEHTEKLDDDTIEVYRSIAPGQNVMLAGEDFSKNETLLCAGQLLRPQEIGLLAAFGNEKISVFRQPVIGVISTGDEVVPINAEPGIGEIRNINAYTLAGLIVKAGGVPADYGIVRDNFDELFKVCADALAQTDMVLISGGSSVGKHDYTVDVLKALPDSEIKVHGIDISPGKPTILAKAGGKAIWGMPGQVTSAMIVFEIVVRPFIEHISGLAPEYRKNKSYKLTARISRNVSSVQGRNDYLRVRLNDQNGVLWAEPVPGKSGLLNTMVQADGLVAIDLNTEGLVQGEVVSVILV